jgi:RNA polymerase sigma factor (sigma-70 family)
MSTNKSHTEIEILITNVIRCKASAQKQMYDLLVLRMYNTVYRILKNKEDTQDCLQVAFSLVFRKIEQFDNRKGSFFSWCTRIFINESLRMLRRKKLKFEEINDSLIVPINYVSPLDDLQAEKVFELINTLPSQMRVIFNLYEIEGYSHKEIAELLNIADSSSRTYLMRAKIKLRKKIESSRLLENHMDSAFSKKRSER